MRFHVGSAAISWAKRNPSITRVILGAMAKSYIAFPRRRSRFFDVLAGETGYLVRVKAQLGNGMKISVPWNDVGGMKFTIQGGMSHRLCELPLLC